MLAIGVLLALAFAPLLFAVANLTKATLAQAWGDGARSLGRAIAGHVAEARTARPPEELGSLLEAQLGHGVGAIALYDEAGALASSAAEPGVTAMIPARVARDRDAVLDLSDAERTAVMVLVPDERGIVGALLYTDAAHLRVGPLMRLVALYTGMLALALLLTMYFALTRIVVAPVDMLRRAAGRVAEGARELSAPQTGAREVVELGASLARMTGALRAEEQALRDKVVELENARLDLERAQESIIRSERLASVGRLAAGLAHEIGNPVTAILSFEDLLLDGPLDDEQREFVSRMKKETERVSRILRDLLTFARPSAPRAAEDEQDTADNASVADAVASVAALLGPQRALDDVELAITVEEGLPAVAISRDRLEQVLLNLLLNAADAVPKPGGRVVLEALADREAVRVSIEDNGGGIEPSVRSRLFEPFVTTKDVGDGTGLGLAVCRGLVEAAGGHIDVEDGAEGARFVLRLPHAAPSRGGL